MGIHHVPRDNTSHLQKEAGPKVLSFSWRLGLRWNETHYETVGVLDVLYAMYQLIITFVTYIFFIMSLTFLFFWSKLRSMK